jgi:hypothetical protein
LDVQITEVPTVSATHRQQVSTHGQNLTRDSKNETITGRAIFVNAKPSRDIVPVDKDLYVIVNGNAHLQGIRPREEGELFPQKNICIQWPCRSHIRRVIEWAIPRRYTKTSIAGGKLQVIEAWLFETLFLAMGHYFVQVLYVTIGNDGGYRGC